MYSINELPSFQNFDFQGWGQLPLEKRIHYFNLGSSREFPYPPIPLKVRGKAEFYAFDSTPSQNELVEHLSFPQFELGTLREELQNQTSLPRAAYFAALFSGKIEALTLLLTLFPLPLSSMEELDKLKLFWEDEFIYHVKRLFTEEGEGEKVLGLFCSKGGYHCKTINPVFESFNHPGEPVSDPFSDQDYSNLSLIW